MPKRSEKLSLTCCCDVPMARFGPCPRTVPTDIAATAQNTAANRTACLRRAAMLTLQAETALRVGIVASSPVSVARRALRRDAGQTFRPHSK